MGGRGYVAPNVCGQHARRKIKDRWQRVTTPLTTISGAYLAVGLAAGLAAGAALAA
jgi:hypothetical protein